MPLVLPMQKKISKPIEIKISTVVAVSAILHVADLTTLAAAMTAMTGGTSDFFDNEFAVIDIGNLHDQTIDWAGLIALFKSHHLNAVAVRNAPAEMHAAILAHDLSIDAGGKPRDAVQAETASAEPGAAETPIEFKPEPASVTAAPGTTPASAAPVAPPAAGARVMIVDTPVRAGQRIYARGCDLIITAVVNNGAEVIADGSIHVYAPLRGRALAGASGNGEARIFALSMEPELVSVAGVYRTFDDGFPAELARQPAQIRLVDDRLDILSLTAVPRA